MHQSVPAVNIPLPLQADPQGILLRGQNPPGKIWLQNHGPDVKNHVRKRP